LAIRRGAGENFAVRSLLVVVLLAGPVRAERYVIQKGETLQHVADAHGCSVEAVMRANHVTTTLLRPGTTIDVPSCSLRARAQTRTRTATPRTRPTSDDERARTALAVIDGATWIEDKPVAKPTTSVDAGVPWDGMLLAGVELPRGDGYRVRRPELAYGVPYVVDHLRRSIAEVRALYPDVHMLAIGDLSAEHGGKLGGHRSHQSGLDVDVGFYFKQVPDDYPDHFAAADDNLDMQATWALLTAFARTTDLDDGVSIMFLDYALQRRLYQWAHKRGTPEADLEHLFQYPNGKDAQTGLIRHWPNHADHVHVRFKSRR
jgi:penicillin-insensitive murein endopeptidase/LysM domain-containing protein